ncbi:hypothetical protein GALMADRAFT_236702 [Galerina marginata CBS 339.88]|uniref:Uncharacterized protein n=1 Tax=Galerina marginata (strain CBS 339.88) TaxID=685588 RepID=A0A067TVV4_GALM3|nr:hypothetical protein GALMADRAFT_236702 [Galerina marginata CBS 339.88]
MAPTTTATKKRKSDTSTSSASKKAKLAVAAHAETVENILSDAANFSLPETSMDTRALILSLAKYARSLEEEVDSYKPKAKSPQELEAAAEKLANVARSGIRKQMTWKPTCKEGRAKWLYDGVCSDAEVFGKLLGLDGSPTFKTKKMPATEFEELIGDLDVAIRYDTLRLTSEVNIHWKPSEGTFKFSGSYGK